jgi:hypothetical protein
LRQGHLAVTRTILAVSVFLGLSPPSALAFDWSINSTVSESVELNDNQFLRTFPRGTLGSYTAITANAQARTPTSRFDFDGDGTFKKYWGPGTEGIPQTEFLNYGFKGRYESLGKNSPDKEFVEASWRQQSTALAILSDLGVATTATGFLDTMAINGGLDRSLTARDSVSLFAGSTRTSYEPSSGGIPFTDTTASGTWRHRLNSISTLSASSSAEILNFDNQFNSEITILRNTVGVDATLSQLLSFRGSIGPAYIQTERGIITTGGRTLPISGAITDWIGDAVLTYKMLKNTTLTLTASQAIGPSVVGSLFKTDTVAVGLVQTINTRSTLSFAASVTRQISTSTTDFVSASATYGYQLAREWSAQVTYRYLHRFATNGTVIFDPITGTPTVSGFGPATSNSVLFVVSRNFTVLPRGQ